MCAYSKFLIFGSLKETKCPSFGQLYRWCMLYCSYCGQRQLLRVSYLIYTSIDGFKQCALGKWCVVNTSHF